MKPTDTKRVNKLIDNYNGKHDERENPQKQTEATKREQRQKNSVSKRASSVISFLVCFSILH